MFERTSILRAASIGGAALLLTACASEAPPPAPPPPVEVKAATVLTRDVPVYMEAIGETRGNREIEIRARVEGFVQNVDFAEGTFVRQGQLLYTLDQAPFEAAVTQAKANLAQAQAELARAQQDVARYEPLVARNAISREEYETAVAVERAQQAAVEAAAAAVSTAEINLGYTRVLSPDSGLIGRTEVYAGTLVGRGQSTLLTRISKIDPIHVRFTIPERDYLQLARRREQEGAPAANTTLQMVLADGSIHPRPGTFAFVDRSVDPLTGTIMLEAAFPNPGGIVRPGQFARVRATVQTRSNAILVPQRAVQELQGVYSVAIVGADSAIEVRNVEVGERVGSLWVITSGLQAGERVVVEGLQKVRPGVTVQAEMVTIDDSALPAAPSEPAAAAATPGN